MRETWFQPLGLVTQPNEMGQYPAGAMAKAENLVARAAGELQTRQNDVQFHTGAIGSSTWITKAIHTGSQIFYISTQPGAPAAVQGTWISGAAVATNISFPDTSHMYLTFNGWPDMLIFRNRLILSSEADPLICDFLNPSNSTERSFRRMGLPQPKIGAAIFSSPSSTQQAVGALHTVGYCAIFRRKFSDGYEIVSPPSLVIRLDNFDPTNPVDPSITVVWSTTAVSLVAGDVYELYRTQSVLNNNGFDIAGTNSPSPDPGTTCYLVHSHTLSSSDIGSGLYTVIDHAKDGFVGQSLGGLGRPLYTNPGQAGLEGANTPPPGARRIAAYKGRVFYANYQTPGDVVLSMRGGIGNFFGDPIASSPWVASGVGVRFITTGDTTNGSSVVTGITAAEFTGIVTGQVAGLGPFTPSNTPITAINSGAGTITLVGTANATATNPLISAEDYVELTYGYGTVTTVATQSLSNYFDVYEVSARTVSDELQFDQSFYISSLYFPTASLALRATNGQNYDPQLPLITQMNNSLSVTAGGTPLSFPPKQFKNGLRWSKDQQPEAVPATNEIFIGNGEIYGMFSTRDALWIFASDGLWRLSGTMTRVGQSVDVRVDPVDSTLILSCPTAGCVLRDSVYAWTNRGFVRVDDNGVVEISNRRVGDILPGRQWDTQPLIVLAADQLNNDIYITTRTSNVLNTFTNYIYSTTYDVFTTTDLTFGFNSPVAYPYDPVNNVLYTVVNTSTGPTGSTWKVANTGSSAAVNPTVDFQPIYAEHPLAMKQWIDSTFVFDTNPAILALTINPRWDATNFNTGPNRPVQTGSMESRINFGTPRSVAIGTALQVGFNGTGASNAYVLKGVSLRFEMLTEQMGNR